MHLFNFRFTRIHSQLKRISAVDLINFMLKNYDGKRDREGGEKRRKKKKEERRKTPELMLLSDIFNYLLSIEMGLCFLLTMYKYTFY